MGLALLLMLVVGTQTSTLNACRRVRALARVTVLTEFLGSAASLVVVWLWRSDGMALAIVTEAVADDVLSLLRSPHLSYADQQHVIAGFADHG